jgi:transcriptional regulator with XRE-family HTH domain
VKSNGKRQYKDDEVLKLIGEKIRELRIGREITLENLANECDLDYSQINRMELGKVNFSISNLYRIARALQVHPKELLTTP